MPVERRDVILNIDNFTDFGTRRKSQKIINEEKCRKIKETNAWKIQDENERQRLEEEERIIFVEVIRRLQKRHELMLKDEFYDFEKLMSYNENGGSPAKNGSCTADASIGKNAVLMSKFDSKKEPLSKKEYKLKTESNRYYSDSLTSFVNLENGKKNRDERDRAFRDDHGPKSPGKSKWRTESEIQLKQNIYRNTRVANGFIMSHDISLAVNAGIVDRMREGIERNIRPEKRRGSGVEVKSDERIQKEASDRRTRESNVSKLMEQYERKIKVEIDIKSAMEREKRNCLKNDINGLVVFRNKNIVRQCSNNLLI